MTEGGTEGLLLDVDGFIGGSEKSNISLPWDSVEGLD